MSAPSRHTPTIQAAPLRKHRRQNRCQLTLCEQPKPYFIVDTPRTTYAPQTPTGASAHWDARHACCHESAVDAGTPGYSARRPPGSQRNGTAGARSTHTCRAASPTDIRISRIACIAAAKSAAENRLRDSKRRRRSRLRGSDDEVHFSRRVTFPGRIDRGHDRKPIPRSQ